MNKFSVILVGLFLITGCSLLPPPYKVPVTQGNILKVSDINKLELGMTTTQVKFVVGSPAIQDNLTPNTWVYTFIATNPNKKTQVSELNKLTLIFDHKQLIDIQKN